MINKKAAKLFASPLNLSLLVLLFTISTSTFIYVVVPTLKYKIASLFSVALSAYIVGWLYSHYVQVKPSKLFRKIVALYYLLFSRLWVIVLSVIFVNSYYEILDLGLTNVTTLIVFSLVSFFLSYFLIYYLFGMGAHRPSLEVQSKKSFQAV